MAISALSVLPLASRAPLPPTAHPAIPPITSTMGPAPSCAPRGPTLTLGAVFARPAPTPVQAALVRPLFAQPASILLFLSKTEPVSLLVPPP